MNNPLSQSAAGATSPDSNEQEPKVAMLCGFYYYLGSRLDSVSSRAAFTMALLGSFLGFVSSPIVQDGASMSSKLSFVAAHPSLAVGIVAMITMLVGETARIRPSNDLFSRIGFSGEAAETVQRDYISASADHVSGEMIVNSRLIGALLRAKIRLYNTGAALFVLAVVLYVMGL